MRRFLLVLLVLLLTGVLWGCSQTAAPETETIQIMDAVAVTETFAETTVPYEEPELPVVDFAALLEEVSTEHKALVENNTVLDTIDQYLVVNKEDVDLLTKEEIDDLVAMEDPPIFMTYEEAVYDVDVLFRAFRSAYGAYYYIGETPFEAAKAEVMEWLEGQSKLKPDHLREKLDEVLSFLHDGHAHIHTNDIVDKTDRYEYYYTEQIYGKDSIGYYAYTRGEKWYVDSFENRKVKMDYRLTTEREIVYSPVLFCFAKEMENGTVTLKNAAGETREETLNWKLTQPFGLPYRTPDFKLLEENGVAYISLRCFDPQFKQGELADFVASGTEVQDAKLIIFDIRSNGGGDDIYGSNWVKKFCGVVPQYPNAQNTRVSRLYNAWLKANGGFAEHGTLGTYNQWATKGKFTANEIPIIVLVDDTCGSAGESMLNYMRSLDNVMVIGSNTAGCQICGKGMSISLPISNIGCSFGSAVWFRFNDENVDDKGYEPDVWCNPVDALDAVLNMLLRYDLTDETSWQNLKSNLS